MQPFIVLSAESADDTKLGNEFRSDALRAALKAKNIRYIELEGVYKGKRERGFAAVWNAKSLKSIRQLAQFFGQESILYVDSVRRASLIYLDGRRDYRVSLGLWRNATKQEAEHHESYSFDPQLRAYFVCY